MTAIGNQRKGIVLDVNMPMMSGIELPVRTQAFDLGCAGFLHKPFFGLELIDSVRKAISQGTPNCFARSSASLR